jgi:predicted transcriptional regulator
MVKIERISLNKNGLDKFFSPNETRILELLWERKKATSSDVQSHCTDLSLACVAGTLDRLTKSGFVERELDETSERVRYIYTASGTRKEMGSILSEKVIESLMDTFGDSVVDTIGKVKKKRGRK